MNFSYWMELIMSGVVTGACYALIGAGLSLIWGTLKMVNLAHGEFYMLGAYILWVSLTVGNMPLLIAIPIAAISVVVIAALLHMATIRPLLRKPGWDMSPWILTLGIQILLQNIALQVWGELYQNVPYFWNAIFKPGNLFTISGQRIIILFGTFAVILLLMFIIKRTKLGRAIIATSQDGEFATMMGINTKRVYLVTYGISAMLAAIAGILMCPVYSVNPWMGTTVQTKGLVVCILGGLGSVEGAIIAGIVMGIVESLTVSVVGSAWRDVAAYLLLIIILYVRPEGLFGRKREG
ncbi:MAG: branched-chain amino acid ABC transporter permease [Lachnospiraceae bacterium]|nr:branched-chain amino acid ABC transporter permease [Lachnospiraceae bacterium]